MKKTLITAAIAALAAASCIAAPHRPAPPSRRPAVHRTAPSRPALPPAPRPHHSHSAWGKGGASFWPGFAGGIVGALLAPPAVVPPPPRPVVYVQRVWVPPVYESRPVYDIYGRVIRYEQVIVVPGYWK